MRAATLGWKLSWATARSTARRVFSETYFSLLSTRETVFMDTPAMSETSLMVGRMSLIYGLPDRLAPPKATAAGAQ